MKKFFTKLFFIVVLLLLSTILLWAKPVKVDEAKDIAYQFLNLKEATQKNMKRVLPASSLSLAYEAKSQNGNSNLFVFNQGEQRFVVVAGDDCISPVLGYADSGAFDEKNMPEGFRYWLESCSRYIEKAKAGAVKREDMTMMGVQSSSYASYVNPLLEDINFGQGDPYNDQCPMLDGERTIVGCVAVSMGQIMTYYQWPTQGKGSHSYVTITDSINVSANFNTTYDWDNILHYYVENDYNTIQKNAIAKMLFHCGVSVDMDYGIGASGTYSRYIPRAMCEYFSYDKGIQLHDRAMYNFNDWKNLIKEELNNNRPVIYSAKSKEGGHAFNCDGYDRNDYFHINWGWYGRYNGYYDLRYLDYEDNENSAYRGSHGVIVGIKPDKGDGTETKTELTYNIVLYKGTSVVRGENGEDTLVCSLWNYGSGEFKGNIALEVFDAKGESDTIVAFYREDVEVEPSYGLWDFRVAALDSYEHDGYSVRLVYREEGENDWKPILAEKGMIATLVYDANSDTWNEKRDEVPMFRLNYLHTIGELNSVDAPRFEVSITSLNDFDYEGDLWVRIWDDEVGLVSQSLKSIFVLAGETSTFAVVFDESVKVGEYNVFAAVDQKNGYLNLLYDVNDSLFFPIKIVDGSGLAVNPKLKIENTYLNKTEFYVGDSIEYTATILNEGGNAETYITLSYHRKNSEGSYDMVVNTESQYFCVYRNSTSSINVDYVITSDFVPGDYLVTIWYWDTWSEDEGRWVEFTPYNVAQLHFSVLEKPYPSFELGGDMKLNKFVFDRGETIEATYTIRNISDVDYYLDLGVVIGDRTENVALLNLEDNTKRVYFPANSEKEITSEIFIPSDFEYGEYRIFAYYYNDWDVEDSGYKYFLPVKYNLKHIIIEEQYEISVISKNDQGKTVGSGRYGYGSEATIAAIPDYGYQFYCWSDNNKENPRVVSIDGNATYEAEFSAITISLEAQPNDEAFEFVEWSDGVIDNPRTISIAEESERQYVAIFRMKETAIENAYITSAHVYSNFGTLYVIGAESDYLVFDEVGKLVYSGNETSIQLPSGVYLVRLGREVQKVVIL